MNFKDLMTKLSSLEEANVPQDSTASPLSHVDNDITIEDNVEECGMPGMDSMPHGMMGAPKQSDSVTMNVSMNGSGAGGIRDIIDILRNIDGGEAEDEMPVAITVDEPDMDHDHDHEHLMGDMGEEYENEPNEMYADAEFSTHDGNDLNKSKTMYKHSYRQGDNPMAAESLKARLAQRYQEIKEADDEEGTPHSHQAKATLKHLKKASYGDKADAANIKPGTKGFKDRYDMLSRAEKEGNLKDSYNPNSVAAQHARDLEKSRVDDLKKKAEAGDEKAKAALKRHEDKKAAMRADFDARMER